MDLSRIINTTKPITVTFLGEEINLEVFSAGYQRLTAEQRIPLNALLGEDRKFASDLNAVQAARLALPLLIKSWDMEWNGNPLPIGEINDLNDDGSRKYDLPDTLLVVLENAVREATADPSTASELPASLAQEESASEPMAVQ